MSRRRSIRDLPRHWTALIIAGVAIFCGGTAFAITQHLAWGLGLYWGLTTAATVGYGDIVPQDTSGRTIAAIMMIIAIPSLGAAWALFTSHTTARRAHTAHDETRRIVFDLYHHVTGGQHPKDSRPAHELPSRRQAEGKPGTCPTCGRADDPRKAR